MLKVAMIANSFPKLSETFILNEAIEIKKQGVELEIIALNHSPDSVTHHSYQENQLDEQLSVISDYDNLSSFGALLAILKALLKCLVMKPSFLLKFIGKCGNRDMYRALVYAAGLGFKPREFDVIYCHFGNNALLISKLRELGFLKGKLAVVFHGFDVSSFLRKRSSGRYQALFSQIDYFLPISRFWKEKLLSLGAEEDKIFVHRMGIDLNKFAYQPRTKGDKIRFVSVCRLTEKKGIVYAVEALAKLKDRLDFEYVIIGDGSQKQNIQQLINEHGISEQVKMLGALRQEQVIEQLAQADIMLAPSVTASDGNMEGIPVVIMEAMARGVLVVSTQHSGIPELVEDGISGFLSEERDVDSLVDKISAACEANWNDVSERALAAVSDEFVTEKSVGRLLGRFAN